MAGFAVLFRPFVRTQSLILSLIVVVIVGTLLAAGVYFWQMRAEYKQLREVQARTARRLSELEQRLKDQDVVLSRLRSDPAYVEKVIRRQLKYARPDEYIFRFEDN